MSDLTQAMLEYAQAIRNDWNDFDGRTERDIIEDWVAEIESPRGVTLTYWRQRLNLCPHGGGHWPEYCRSHECDTATA